MKINIIHENGAFLLLPEDVRKPLFTVVCIGNEDTAVKFSEILPFSIALIIIPVKNWYSLSPFSAPALSPDEHDFTPGADEILEQIRNTLPYFTDHYPLRTDPEGHGLMGYSLAGLCVLYALHKRMNEFKWFYALSASVWMEGWKEFAETHSPLSDARVWLSLGGKESNTKNFRMARVGDAYREEERLLKALLHDGNVRMTWQPGGHFADSSKRMLAALTWSIEMQKKEEHPS